MDDTIRKRGRPRQLDREVGLVAAARLFWEHGYEGTSIAELTKAMGVTPPSLYATFGSKEQLYREAVDYTAERENRVGFTALFGQMPAYEAVALYLRNAAERFTDPTKPNGCMVSTAALQHASDTASAAQIVADRRDDTLQLVTARFDRAIDEGELPPGTDTRALARFYGAMIQGMSAQSCDGATVQALHPMIDFALAAWPGKRSS